MNDAHEDADAPFIPTRNALKAVLIVTLYFATFLAGLAALFLKQFVAAHNNSRVFTNTFSFVSVFGAGVFLATCLLDLLPESLECFEKASEILKSFGGFPFPELCVASGFLLVLMLEQAILYANERRWIGDAETGRLLNDHDDSTREHRSNSNSEIVESSATTDQQYQQDETPQRHHSHSPQFHVRTIEGDVETSESTRAPLMDVSDLNLPATEHEHSAIRVLLLVFALSLHAVFEGLSLGMITDVPVLLQVFFALLIHKSIIGFSLGIRVFQSKLRRTVGVLCCIVFAGQVIIGGFIGVAVVDIMNRTSREMSSFVSGLLQGIACGTFLYITCFEILPHELNNSVNRPAKMVFLLLGFALICVFVYVFPG